MVDKEQFIQGILTFIDEEIIPQLPASGKWGLGTFLVLATSKYEQIFDSLVNNDFVKMLEITDGDNVDIKRLSEALKKSASKYGKLTITLPVIGSLIFSADDVDKLEHYIDGGKVL